MVSHGLQHSCRPGYRSYRGKAVALLNIQHQSQDESVLSCSSVSEWVSIWSG